MPAVIILPGEVKELDLQPLISAAAERADLDSVSVRILNNGSPGSLIGALYSQHIITKVTQDIPLRDSGRLRSSTGAYPWRLDADYSSVVYVSNVGSQLAEYAVKIY